MATSETPALLERSTKTRRGEERPLTRERGHGAKALPIALFGLLVAFTVTVQLAMLVSFTSPAALLAMVPIAIASSAAFDGIFAAVFLLGDEND